MRGELTVQAIFAAVIVAAIMGASYPYMVLKLGFGPNVSVVSAFFGFLILNIVARKTYDRWQNNIVQTAGTSAAQTAFMCIILAAFDMLRASKIVTFEVEPTPLQTFVWLSVASLLGTLLAVPMRRHFIVDEKLPFPDGLAAGETLIVLDPPRGVGKDDPTWKRARQAAKILGVGLLLSGLVMIFRDDAKMSHLIPEGWDPGMLTLGAAGAAFVVASMGVGVSYSLLSIGTGMLVGLRVNIWMMTGCTLGWIIFPLILTQQGILQDHPTRTQVLYWIMWPATGMLMSGGLTALVLRWRSLVETFKSMRGASLSSDEFPLGWVVGGSVFLTGVLCAIQYFALGLPIWMTLLSVALTIPLMLVGLRVMGETNWGPISVTINLMQAMFAAFAPGNITANMLTSGATGTVASTSEGLMQDYKVGEMIGSTPRNLTIAQLIAAPIGAGAVAIVYPALVKTYGIIGDNAQLAAPASRRMAGFAELLSAGVSKLPPSAMWTMLVFVILGIIIAVLEERPALKKWVPSSTGMALGMLLPFAAVSTMFIGAVIGQVWKTVSPRSAETNITPLASGFIAGEALIAVIVPVLLWMHLGYK